MWDFCREWANYGIKQYYIQRFKYSTSKKSVLLKLNSFAFMKSQWKCHVFVWWLNWTWKVNFTVCMEFARGQ